MLGDDAYAFRATLFDKTAESNRGMCAAAALSAGASAAMESTASGVRFVPPWP